MPNWTYYLTVHNQLDRPFKLETKNIAWGRTEGEDVCREIFRKPILCICPRRDVHWHRVLPDFQ